MKATGGWGDGPRVEECEGYCATSKCECGTMSTSDTCACATTAYCYKEKVCNCQCPNMIADGWIGIGACFLILTRVKLLNELPVLPQ